VIQDGHLSSSDADYPGHQVITYPQTDDGFSATPTQVLNLGQYLKTVSLVDVNGDGLPDIIQSYTDSGGAWHNAAYTNSNRFRADLLTGITYPQGGSAAISYQSILQLTDDLGNVLNGVPYPVYIVSKITSNDGTQNVATSTYVYYGGTYYVNGPFDHQFAGFTQVKETDAAGNVTKTYYHTSNGTDSAHGEYQDDFWKIGKPYRIESYDNAGKLYRTVVNGWDAYALGGNAGFVKLATTTEKDYDGLSTHADKAESYTYDNATGNQTQRIQWGQVTANDDGTFTDTGTDEFVTATSYATSTTGVVGLPSDVTVTDQGSNKVRETRYYYDSLALGLATVGNLTKQEDWKTGGTYVNVQNSYNSYGLVTQHLDPRGKQTNYSYNAFAMFRNYDGAGGKFGNVSVGAASSYSGVHAYAATDSVSNPTTLWIMLVNTGTSAQSNMTVTINNFAAGASAKVYQSVSGATPAAGANATISGGVITGLSAAANSITLLVVGH